MRLEQMDDIICSDQSLELADEDDRSVGESRKIQNSAPARKKPTPPQHSGIQSQHHPLSKSASLSYSTPQLQTRSNSHSSTTDVNFEAYDFDSHDGHSSASTSDSGPYTDLSPSTPPDGRSIASSTTTAFHMDETDSTYSHPRLPLSTTNVRSEGLLSVPKAGTSSPPRLKTRPIQNLLNRRSLASSTPTAVNTNDGESISVCTPLPPDFLRRKLTQAVCSG